MPMGRGALAHGQLSDTEDPASAVVLIIQSSSLPGLVIRDECITGQSLGFAGTGTSNIQP